MIINTKLNVEHPGSFIREELEERGWSQSDLAYIVGRPVQAINTIISGKRGISTDMAKAFGMAFDVPAEFFINLQKIYDLSKAGEPDSGIAKRARFFQKSYPVREMIKRGWLEDTEPDLLEAQMKRFFEANNIENIPHFDCAAKKTHYDNIPPNQLAWLFRVRQVAKSIEAPKFSKKKLNQALQELKTLMMSPEEIRHIPRILADCGIRFIIIEPLPNAKIDGVCFWLNNSSPVIGVSMRYDRIDNFWFVLIHEIDHVSRRHGIKQEIIDTELTEQLENDSPVSEEEQLVNDTASNYCVPNDKLDSFIARKYPYISERDLLGFARNIQVHPGIVVGQLHHKTKEYKYFRKHLIKVREYLETSALMDGWGTIIPINL